MLFFHVIPNAALLNCLITEFSNHNPSHLVTFSITPATLPKSDNILRAQHISSLLLIYNIPSSAYCEILTHLFLLPINIPSKLFDDLILMAKISTAKINKIPETGHPWRMPFDMQISSERCPLFLS